MKVSNLIAELQSIQDKHGDIDVKVENHQPRGDEAKDMNIVQVFTDSNKSKFIYIK